MHYPTMFDLLQMSKFTNVKIRGYQLIINNYIPLLPPPAI